MNIGPSPELAAACRLILGADTPAVVINAIRYGGTHWDLVRQVHAGILRAGLDVKSMTSAQLSEWFNQQLDEQCTTDND